MERRTRAHHRAEEIDISPTKLAAEIERLTGERDAARAETEAARRERDEFVLALQRERAEFQNFRRRATEEREAMLGLAGEDLIRKVLALADDFDRAIDARPDTDAPDPWVEGIAAIDRKLRQLLESEGVTAIDAAPGVRFDPREHEAVANIPGTGRAEGEIVEELRRGYRLRDRVIRPAMVAVAEGPGHPAGGDPSDQPDRSTRPIH